MSSKPILVLALLLLLQPFGDAHGQEASSAVPAPATAPVDTPTAPPPVSAAQAALPPMRFVSSVASDKLFDALKAQPGMAGLDKDLHGSPLTLLVTHTSAPTAGGQAAGFLSAIISGSTLGIIPMVTNEQLVVRYEVLLNGKPIATHHVQRTATRAISMWAAGDDEQGLGRDGMAWLLDSAKDAAAALIAAPEVAAVRQEIAYFFPATSTPATP